MCRGHHAVDRDLSPSISYMCIFGKRWTSLYWRCCCRCPPKQVPARLRSSTLLAVRNSGSSGIPSPSAAPHGFEDCLVSRQLIGDARHASKSQQFRPSGRLIGVAQSIRWRWLLWRWSVPPDTSNKVWAHVMNTPWDEPLPEPPSSSSAAERHLGHVNNKRPLGK